MKNIIKHLVKKKNKKGLSELVSYVLLVVISLSIAIGVYAWLKGNLPSENERPKCPEDVAIVVSDYNCNLISSPKILQLKVENKGYFTVDGFYIRVSNNSEKLPTLSITTIDGESNLRVQGQYYSTLNPGETVLTNFSYGEIETVKKVQIQAIYNTTICSNIATVDLEGC